MGWWSVLAILTPPALAVVRELLALRKDSARRGNVERIVIAAPVDLRIIDRAANGDAVEIIFTETSERTGSTGRDPSAS